VDSLTTNKAGFKDVESAAKHVNKAIKRHGVEKAHKLGQCYGSGLVEGFANDPAVAKHARQERIIQNFGSLDGARTKKNGHRGFSLTNLGIALIETTTTYVDYNHVRNMAHQVVEDNGEWFHQINT